MEQPTTAPLKWIGKWATADSGSSSTSSYPIATEIFGIRGENFGWASFQGPWRARTVTVHVAYGQVVCGSRIRWARVIAIGTLQQQLRFSPGHGHVPGPALSKATWTCDEALLIRRCRDRGMKYRLWWLRYCNLYTARSALCRLLEENNFSQNDHAFH